MRVRVRLFAALRDRAGTDEIELELPEGAVVADALERLRSLTGDLRAVLAVNREYARAQTALHPDDELALIPPVSGGAGEGAGAAPGVISGDSVSARFIHVRVTPDPLELGALAASVRDPRAGAVVVFEGVTREVASLEYEAYAEMAGEKIEAIVVSALDRHELCGAAVEHRIGVVPLSEPSVVVAVSAPHREAAFAAAREIIDRLKVEVPIWKREEGEWVEGETPHAQG
jgi:molybdopterin synthase catalytic subunit